MPDKDDEHLKKHGVSEKKRRKHEKESYVTLEDTEASNGRRCVNCEKEEMLKRRKEKKRKKRKKGENQRQDKKRDLTQ